MNWNPLKLTGSANKVLNGNDLMTVAYAVNNNADGIKALIKEVLELKSEIKLLKQQLKGDTNGN